MLRSDWGKRVKAGLKFGLPIAILSLGFIAWGLSESAKYQGEANNHARQYAEHARDKVEQSCVGSAPLKKRECINEAREKQRAGERDEQDLVAQRQSALWAYIMGAAAVIGMGLSAVGVYLVWTTFAETRESNNIAKRTAADQLRPYVYITDEFMELDSGCAKIKLHLRNFGQTPAKNVVVRLCGFVRPYYKENIPKNVRKMETRIFCDMPLGLDNWTSEYQVTGLSAHHKGLSSGAKAIYVDGYIRYTDSAGNRYRTDFRRVSAGKAYQNSILLVGYGGNEAT
jgi:hypothetical protein